MNSFIADILKVSTSCKCCSRILRMNNYFKNCKFIVIWRNRLLRLLLRQNQWVFCMCIQDLRIHSCWVIPGGSGLLKLGQLMHVTLSIYFCDRAHWQVCDGRKRRKSGLCEGGYKMREGKVGTETSAVHPRPTRDRCQRLAPSTTRRSDHYI